MGQHNQNTLTLLGIVQQAVTTSNYAIDQYPEFRELFEGQAPANVHTQVPGQFHKGKNGARGRPKTIYEVVTQDPNFGENAQGIVRQAWQRQTSAAPRAPGKTEEQAMEALDVCSQTGLLATVGQLPLRGARGQALVDRVRAAAAARGGGRDGRSGRD